MPSAARTARSFGPMMTRLRGAVASLPRSTRYDPTAAPSTSRTSSTVKPETKIANKFNCPPALVPSYNAIFLAHPSDLRESGRFLRSQVTSLFGRDIKTQIRRVAAQFVPRHRLRAHHLDYFELGNSQPAERPVAPTIPTLPHMSGFQLPRRTTLRTALPVVVHTPDRLTQDLHAFATRTTKLDD